MRKSTARIFKLLPFKKLNLFLSLAMVILVVSGGILFLGLKVQDFENPSQTAQKINIQCQKDSSSRCFKSFFSVFAQEHSFDKSKAVLDELQKINPAVRYCHGIAHAISIAEVEKNPQKWLKVFDYVPEIECSVGFFHGVIEGKYRTEADFVIDPKVINQVCLETQGVQKSSQSSGRCAHAFGHILLVQNLADVKKSLGICQSLPSKLVQFCFQGVFMEDIQRENLLEHGIAEREVWDKDYLEGRRDYCNEFSGVVQGECWRSLGPVILAVVSSLDEGIGFCQSASEYFARRFCIREVTGQEMIDRLAGRNGRGRPVTDSCLLFINEPDKYKNCIMDLAGYVLLTSDAYKGQMVELCNLAGNGVKDRCLEQVKNY